MISNALAIQLNREDLTLCRLFEITIGVADTFRYTDHSASITYQGFLYRADPGVEISSVRRSVVGSAASVSARIAYDDLALTERTVRFGGTDNAPATITLIDYTRPDIAGAVLISGKVKRSQLTDKFSCTLDVETAAKTAANTPLTEVYSQRCRNIFGDSRCGIDVEAMQVDFTVTETFADNLSFRVNNQFLPDAPVDDPMAEPNPIVNGSIRFDVPGVVMWTVPNTGAVVVEAASSGGSAGSSVRNILDPRVTSFADGYDGNDGDALRFGEWVLLGGERGKAGIANYRPNPIGSASIAELTRQNVSRLQKPPAPETPNLDYLLAGPNGWTEVAPGQGAGAGLGVPYLGVPNSEGGDGARGHAAALRFVPNAPGKPMVGDVISITIPGPAIGGGFDGTPGGLYAEGQDGFPGAMNISWTGSQPDVAQEATSEEFALGTVLWVTGDNVGVLYQVKESVEGRIYLLAATRYPIKTGDTGFFRPGCTNYADVCKMRYDNLHNMQAEPAVPQGLSSIPSGTTTVPTDTTQPPPATTEPAYMPNPGGFPMEGSGS